MICYRKLAFLSKSQISQKSQMKYSSHMQLTVLGTWLDNKNYLDKVFEICSHLHFLDVLSPQEKMYFRPNILGSSYLQPSMDS